MRCAPSASSRPREVTRCGSTRAGWTSSGHMVGRSGTPAHHAYSTEMSRSVEECNRRMLRARDAMDRAFAEPLCIPQLARIADVSEAHFIRTFRDTFGETP